MGDQQAQGTLKRYYVRKEYLSQVGVLIDDVPQDVPVVLTDDAAREIARLKTALADEVHRHEQAAELARVIYREKAMLEARVREVEQSRARSDAERDLLSLRLHGTEQERDRLAQRVKELEGAAG